MNNQKIYHYPCNWCGYTATKKCRLVEHMTDEKRPDYCKKIERIITESKRETTHLRNENTQLRQELEQSQNDFAEEKQKLIAKLKKMHKLKNKYELLYFREKNLQEKDDSI